MSKKTSTGVQKSQKTSNKPKKNSSRHSGATTTGKGNVAKYFNLTLIGFCILVFYPPFFKGLFFEVAQQWTLFFASIIFLVCILWQRAKKQLRFLEGAFSYLVFLLPCIYLLSAFNAADLRLAVAEIVKMLLYFLVFWIAGNLAMAQEPLIRKLKGRTLELKTSDTILKVLYLSAAGVALVGFLGAVGIVKLPDIFVEGRIYSTMQYPNTLAMLLAAAMCFGFWLWLTEASQRWRLFLVAGNYLLIYVFIATFSRGGYLVFAGMLLLYLVLMPGEFRVSWLGHVAVITILGGLCVLKGLPAVEVHNYAIAWLWFLACGAAAVFVHWGLSRILSGDKSLLGQLSAKKVVTTVVIIFVLIGGGLALWAGSTDTQVMAGDGDGTWYANVLPAQVANRLQDFNLESRSAQLRMYWSVEAMKIVREHPILGMGGGAWEAYNLAIQDYPFDSSQVHNHFVQLWAETGTVGFLVFLGIWLSFIIVSWKNFRRASGSREKLLDVTILIVGIGIGAHSWIDFDLSLSSIAIVLWTCFGLAWGRSLTWQEDEAQEGTSAKGRPGGGNRHLVIGAASLVAFLSFVLSASLLISISYQKAGLQYGKAGRIDRAESSFVAASRFDPFSSEIRVNLASIKSAQKDNEAAIEYMEQAVKRSPYNFRVYGDFADIYLANGDVEKGIETAKSGVKVAPWTVKAYQNLADAYVQGGMILMQKKDIEGAAKYFTECEEIPQVLKAREEIIPDRADELWTGRDKFYQFTPTTKMAFGVSQLYLEKFEPALANLLEAADNDTLKPQADFWLAVLARKTGNEEEAEAFLAGADEALRSNFDSVASLTAVP